jgi:hypothetical protein
MTKLPSFFNLWIPADIRELQLLPRAYGADPRSGDGLACTWVKSCEAYLQRANHLVPVLIMRSDLHALTVQLVFDFLSVIGLH